MGRRLCNHSSLGPVGHKAAKLHGGGKSQLVLGFRVAFLSEFPHQARVGQLSLPCTEGCDHRQGTGLKRKASGLSSVRNSRWLITRSLPSSSCLFPDLSKAKVFLKRGKYRPSLTTSSRSSEPRQPCQPVAFPGNVSGHSLPALSCGHDRSLKYRNKMT